MAEAGVASVADMEQDEVLIDIQALPDALLIQVLESLGIAELGRCLCVSSRFSTLAADDVLWRARCIECFGLTDRSDPEGAACGSFREAAKRWSAFGKRLGMSKGSEAMPVLAPQQVQARETWRRLSAWAGEHLVEAAQSIAPPATSIEWRRFCGWLGLPSDDVSPALLQLRVSERGSTPRVSRTLLARTLLARTLLSRLITV